MVLLIPYLADIIDKEKCTNYDTVRTFFKNTYKLKNIYFNIQNIQLVNQTSKI